MMFKFRICGAMLIAAVCFISAAIPAQAQNAQKLKEAIQQSTRILRNDPDNGHIYSHRGATYAQLNLHELAIKDFTQALKLLGPDQQVYDLGERAKSYLALGRYDKAIEDFDAVLKATDNPAWTTSVIKDRATAYRKKGVAEVPAPPALEGDGSAYSAKNQNLEPKDVPASQSQKPSPDASKLENSSVAQTQVQSRPVFRDKKDCDDKYMAMLMRHGMAIGNVLEKIPKPGAETRAFCTHMKTMNDQVERNLAEERALKGSVCWSASKDQGLAGSEKKLADARATQDKICADARAKEAQPKKAEDERRAPAQNENKPADPKSQAWNWCAGKDGASDDLKIGSCTNVIQSGKESPQDLAVAFYNRGVAYFAKNDLEKSIADYDQSIRLAPELPPAYNNRGFIYLVQKNHAQAIQDFDEAIKRNGKYVVAFINRGQAYYRSNQIDRAIEDYDQAIKLEPGEGAFRGRGIAYARKKEFARAIQDYDEAINLDPKSSMAYLFRGISRDNLRQPELAKDDWGQAIKLNPSLSTAFVLRGLTYSEEKKYELAIQDFSSAIKIDAKDKDTIAARGTAYSRSEKYDLAIQDFNRALDLDPNDPDVLRKRGQAKEKAGDAAGAKLDLDAAFKMSPKKQ
jgi:tetratricopeptide (TPR) repeat protein